MIEIFIILQEDPGQKPRIDTIGVVDPVSGEYPGYNGQLIGIDFSNMKNGFRGERSIIVDIEGIGRRAISISRRSGLGQNTINPYLKIGVEIFDPKIYRKVNSG